MRRRCAFKRLFANGRFDQLSGWPFVTTGTRDTAALGIGIIGLVIAGPMELFFPEEAASQFGGKVWLLLIAFYGLCVSLIVLLLRSRIVVYNITGNQLDIPQPIDRLEMQMYLDIRDQKTVANPTRFLVNLHGNLGQDGL